MEERQIEQQKDMEEPKLNSEKIWKIQKKIVKRQGKYSRKLGKDIKNMEERQVEQ